VVQLPPDGTATDDGLVTHVTSSSPTLLLPVTAPPTQSPILQSSKDFYDLSDIVNLTCTSPPAKPLPHLSWLINGETAPIEYVLPFENGTGSQLLFPLQVQHLQDGKPRMEITCEASFNYSQSSYGNYTL
jgi:hypothetical protein